MKNTRGILSWILPIILACALCPLKSQASTVYHSVSVPAEYQYMSNWCWAACARMAGKTMYYASSRSQFAIVNLIYGSPENQYPNVGGLIDDSVTGSEYVAYYHRSFAYTLSAWSFSSIDNHIANGKPVQAIQHHYKPGTGQWNHVVIISQTAHVEDSTGSYFAVSYIDPLDGNNYSKLFSAFCNETVNNDTITYIQTVYVSN